MPGDPLRGTDEAAFLALCADWAQGGERAVARWEPSFAAMLGEQRALAARGSWVGGPSDLLTIIGRSRWETFHSAMVAWLLWPAARHGLGTSLLRATLERGFPAEDTAEERLVACSVFTEVTAAQSRADILVEGPDLKLVVEVKVDAEEGDRQCQRLLDDHLADGVLFLFLTPSGRAPVSADPESRHRWRTASFAELRADLERCLARVMTGEPAAVATARSYLETLKKEFP